VSAGSDPPQSVIEAFALDADSITPLTGGLINRSFSARRRAGGETVLQRVNPIFAPAVNDDIDAVTRHLEARGLVTPRLIPTLAGDRFVRHGDQIWRLLTRIEGETFDAIADAAAAREAGRVLGAFHAALADYPAPLSNRRPGVHDLPRHLAGLRRALDVHRDHPAFTAVAELAQAIFAVADELDPLPELPSRLVHGDPKISNVVFAGGRAVCLVDLDTIAAMPAPLDLGDALRSWCNTASEDAAGSAFSIERFDAAIAGYRAGAGELLGADEWRAVPAATLTIAVELAARFAADALAESYFAWDRQRFDSASAHNRARAAAQLGLARSLRAALPAMSARVVTRM